MSSRLGTTDLEFVRRCSPFVSGNGQQPREDESSRSSAERPTIELPGQGASAPLFAVMLAPPTWNRGRPWCYR
jgi:hypothetical protein